MAERLKSSARRNVRRGIHTLEAGVITAAALAGPAAVANATQSSEVPKAETAHVHVINSVSNGGVNLDTKKIDLSVGIVTPPQAVPDPDIKPAYKVYTVKKGDTLSKIIASDIKKDTGEKATADVILDAVAVSAQASGVEDADSINPGDKIVLPDAAMKAELGNKVNGNLIKEVGELRAVRAHTGYDSTATRKEASDVIKAIGVTVPDVNNDHTVRDVDGKTIHEQLGVKKEELISDISSAEMQRRIDNARENGWIETAALNSDHIWGQQKYEDKKNVQSNAETNETSRMAVQITTFDKNVNKDGKFDERKMQEGAKFNEFNEHMDTLMGAIGSMSARDVLELRDTIKDRSVYLKLVQAWAVNQGTTVNDDIPNRDVAAASVYLEIAEKINLKDAPNDVIAFINTLQNTTDRDAQIALLLNSPDMVKKLFVAQVVPPATTQTPDHSGNTTPGSTGTTNSQRPESLGPWST